MTLSPSFWKVSETKISDKVSHVTPLSELIEMVQYTAGTYDPGIEASIGINMQFNGRSSKFFLFR